MINIESLKNVILNLCKSKNITINKLATQTGITQSTIDSILKGKSLNPKLETVISLADYFDVSLDYLVGRSDDPKRY